MNEKPQDGGPLPIINAVITRFLTPGKPIYFRPFIGVISLPIEITGFWAHFVTVKYGKKIISSARKKWHVLGW